MTLGRLDNFREGRLPDFLVIGAQKAGTTFLYQSLLQHPLIAGSYGREVHYFSNDERSQGGAAGYRRYFPTRENLPEGAIVGEKSPGYLARPEAAARASCVVPGAKIIAVLRNPVERAFSNHQHVATKLGADPFSFEEAIEAEAERMKSQEEGRRFGYLMRSRYIEHLPYWYEKFGPKVLVLQAEEMYQQPARALKQACDFLGVLWDRTHFNLRKSRGKLANRKSGRYAGTIKPETRRYLEEYFEPYNQELYRYLGRDFGWSSRE